MQILHKPFYISFFHTIVKSSPCKICCPCAVGFFLFFFCYVFYSFNTKFEFPFIKLQIEHTLDKCYNEPWHFYENVFLRCIPIFKVHTYALISFNTVQCVKRISLHRYASLKYIFITPLSTIFQFGWSFWNLHQIQ